MFNILRLISGLSPRQRIKGGNLPYGEYGAYRWETTGRNVSEMYNDSYDFNVIFINKTKGMTCGQVFYDVSNVQELSQRVINVIKGFR